jgi:antitoxin FitA
MALKKAVRSRDWASNEVSSSNGNSPFPEPTGIDPTMPDSQIAPWFLLPLIACVGALFVGWFIACDPNPLTTSAMLAGLVMCCVALSNPVWGVYLLIFTTGYLDLVKRLGILSDALSGIDVVVTLALTPVLFLAICGGVLYRNIITGVLRPMRLCGRPLSWCGSAALCDLRIFTFSGSELTKWLARKAFWGEPAIIDSTQKMAQLLVRDLEPEVVRALKRRAVEEGTSVEEAHRRLLREALLGAQSRLSFKEALLRMPDDGDDGVFERKKKQRRQPAV